MSLDPAAAPSHDDLAPLPQEYKDLIDQAHSSAHDELAAALSAARKLMVVATAGVGRHLAYVERFSVAERKGLSLVLDLVQPREQRAAVQGLASYALAQRHDAAVDFPAIDHSLRKAIAHAVIALEALDPQGVVVDDRAAARDATPSVFSSPSADALLANRFENDGAVDAVDAESATLPSARPPEPESYELGGPSDDPRDRNPDGGIWDRNDPRRPSAADLAPANPAPAAAHEPI